MKAEYITHMGDDRLVANAARVSFAQDSSDYTDEQMIGLLGYLARGVPSKEWGDLAEQIGAAETEERLKLMTYIKNIPTHWAPFAHPQITLKMQAPVSIRTQCFKHKVSLVESEESRRYISSTPEFYMPDFFRPIKGNVKQGSTDEPHEHDAMWMMEYRLHMKNSIKMYEAMIKNGVCPEQARFVLPQGCEVNWVWTGSLYAFANFYIQRSDPHAQKEIRILAEKVAEIIQPLFPESWKALTS